MECQIINLAERNKRFPVENLSKSMVKQPGLLTYSHAINGDEDSKWKVERRKSIVLKGQRAKTITTNESARRRRRDRVTEWFVPRKDVTPIKANCYPPIRISPPTSANEIRLLWNSKPPPYVEREDPHDQSNTIRVTYRARKSENQASIVDFHNRFLSHPISLFFRYEWNKLRRYQLP